MRQELPISDKLCVFNVPLSSEWFGFIRFLTGFPIAFGANSFVHSNCHKRYIFFADQQTGVLSNLTTKTKPDHHVEFNRTCIALNHIAKAYVAGALAL